jgi:tetratricopeptide (TPR) repeat protein
LAERAFAYRNLNRYDLAIADLTKLMEKQPNDAEAYRRRVCSYRLANHYEKAVTDFRKVLELRPGDADATRV